MPRIWLLAHGRCARCCRNLYKVSCPRRVDAVVVVAVVVAVGVEVYIEVVVAEVVAGDCWVAWSFSFSSGNLTDVALILTPR